MFFEYTPLGSLNEKLRLDIETLELGFKLSSFSASMKKVISFLNV